MSHIVTLRTEVRDAEAVRAACRRLGLDQPVQGTARLFEGEASGLLVKLPGWTYPAIVDIATGQINYDNYGGSWGSQEHLDRFLQSYAVEKAKLEARRKGYAVSEQALQDGSILVQIVEAR